MVDKGTLPGANAEVRHREARWAAQAGQADTTTGRERAPDDHFRGASITKTFIATVLLQLEGVRAGGGVRRDLVRGEGGRRERGGTNGSASAMVGSLDGRHQLTFHINGDWIMDGPLYVNVIEAEFCGKVLEPRRGGPHPWLLSGRRAGPAGRRCGPATPSPRH
ncbi:serine hydrolase [Streptomyces koyangensis]|uniref:serine hydrolase n=1 Tax=Streptomyces koyangensis TaxID=188770 RepID=UPI0033912554